MDQITPPINNRTNAAIAVMKMVQQIEANIRTGDWPAGYRLPAERDLCSEFGVARNTLRKGLKHLEDEKKIVRYVGRGSFVSADVKSIPTPGFSLGILNRITGASPAEVMEVRLMLEPWAAALAATRASTTDLTRIREILARGADAVDSQGFETADGELHMAIIEAGKNELLAGLSEVIHIARLQPEWMKAKRRSLTPEKRQQYQLHHEKMVDALIERDPDAASKLVKEHLLAVRTSLIGSTD